MFARRCRTAASLGLPSLGLSALLLLAGCQTVPVDPPRPLSAKAEDGRGRIVIRPFYMPEGINVIAGLMGGGQGPFQATLYDVTGQPRYLGPLHSAGVLNPSQPLQTAFEYDADPGQRVLMLHMRKFGGGDFVDFVEVPVGANEIRHVAVSQYGMNDRPYLVNVDFDQRATRHCGSTPGLKPNEAAAYLKANGMAESRYAVRYCLALSTQTRPRTVPVDAAWTAPLPPERIAALRDQYLPIWRSMAERIRPYDLTQPGQKGM